MARLRNALLLLLVSLPLLAEAAQFRDFGPYRVHYNAFNSTVIAPEVAQAYGLDRSRFRGILNITIQRRDGESPWPATQAAVDATASSLVGRVRNIDMHEIREGEAIYYIGEFPVSNQEKLDFTVEVRPADSSERYSLDFSQRFFTD